MLARREVAFMAGGFDARPEPRWAAYALSSALALLVAACAPITSVTPTVSAGASGPPRNPAAFERRASYEPYFDPANFVGVVDNPYYPLAPGTTMVYRGGTETVEVTVTNETRQILGVTAIVVHDQVLVDGEVAEDTFDWYAQDGWGNVWYLGEDTKEYEAGEVVSTEGSWEAGVDGAQPGIIMLADPRVGDSYRQEFYAGEAEDFARVVGHGESVEVPYGTYHNVLVTEDWSALDPDIVEHKSYAHGIGVVMEEQVQGGNEVLQLVEVRQGS